MKARTVSVRPTLGPVAAAEVVSVIAFAALWPWQWGWWPWATITVAALAVMVITVHRRNLAAWCVARIRHLRQRRYATNVGAAVDIHHGNAIYGVRTAGTEAVTMIRVDGRPYMPTYLRGSTVSHTANELPLEVLTGLLDQPADLHIGIDIVSDGQRVRSGTGYPELYSTLLADRPAAGQRTTRLIVRLDLPTSVRGLLIRRSVGKAAAAVTERIIKALEQEGIRATAVNAEDLNAALTSLSLGLAVAPTPPEPADELDDTEDAAGDAAADAGEPDEDSDGPSEAGRHRLAANRPPARPRKVREPRVRPGVDVLWNRIYTKPGYVTSYYFSPEDITTDAFNRMWALRADHVVHTIILRKQHDPNQRHYGKVLVSSLVRTTDPRPPQGPPTLFLNTLPGDQYDAALRAAPTSAPALKLPAKVLESPRGLTVPIGETGILVGSARHDIPTAHPAVQRDDLVMWPLTDPQRPTRITMATSDFYVRQLLIRTAATGKKIAIYSSDPQRWMSIAEPNIAVVTPGRPAEFVPSIIVNDNAQIAPSAGLSSTVITLGRSQSGAPDMRFQQIDESTIRIIHGARSMDISQLVFRHEQTWTGEPNVA
ncbi:type VII secretion protein EccE [Mycolicibacterium llatzerense]|uniref:type VII secretion protein EccE n=1 Tax=Mycolicibacterium llatzerense TaxID=280871 RepID=UPI0031DBEF75